MNPERYQIIKRHFHAALEQPESERAAFLAQACGADAELFADVEALLNADKRPGSFLDAPAYEMAAGLLIDPLTGELEGTALGPYRIVRLLGAGGMGEVYLAEDSRLGRQVALKLMPDHLARDPDLVRRFRQEARAASALNHPNLASIYEIEQADGRHFIAMEFVAGETLRRIITRGPMPTAEALRIAAQVAGALAEAHQIGIVHRDIKPENIMLDSRGRIKILDFGLAKYAPEPANVSAAADSYLTTPGLLMGTTAYMSPEQVRAIAVDARTDLWSLGVVLYEMIAGAPPFSGPSRSDVIAAILEREPFPLKLENRAATAKLALIIGKLLARDRRERYAAAADLVEDLEALRRELEPGFGTASSAVSIVTDSVGQPPLKAGRSKIRTVLFALVAVLVLSGSVLVALKLWRPAHPVPASPGRASLAPERQLSYWIEVQKYRGGKPFQAPFRLGKEIVFENDYQIRLHLRSAQDGHLYVISEGPSISGQPVSFVILFPSSTANAGNSRLSAGSELQIPADTWFVFDAKQGTERLWLVYSSTPIPSLEALKGLANPRDRGLISEPDSRVGVRTLLNSPPASKPSVFVDEENREVRLNYNGDTLVYLLRLEHH